MSDPFQVVTWNLHRAAVISPAWTHFREISPDLALLQEVGRIPADVAEAYTCRMERAMASPRCSSSTPPSSCAVTLARR